MKAFWVDTGRRVLPFDESPRDSAYASSTLGEAVRAALTRQGVSVETVAASGTISTGDEPALVLSEDLFVSEKCLGDFLKGVSKSETMQQLWLCKTPAVDYALPCGTNLPIEPLDAAGNAARPVGAKGPEAKASSRVGYDLFYLPRGTEISGPVLEHCRQKAAAFVVKKREINIPIQLPLLGRAEAAEMIFPVTSTVAMHVEHWVHILWLNQLAFGIRWMELVRSNKFWTAGRVLLSFPFSRHHFLRSFVRKGRGCKIHPSAYIEASILGDNVTVGPRATIRNSIIGDNVHIGSNASVLSSTLGTESHVAPKGFVVWSTVYEHAVAGNMKMQMSVLGRAAALSMWAGLIDAKFQSDIRVMKDGVAVSTERRFLGSAVGHRSFVDAKVLIHPGREIPNDTHIAMRPDELISEVPADLAPNVPLVRDAGTLVPLSEVLARK